MITDRHLSSTLRSRELLHEPQIGVEMSPSIIMATKTTLTNTIKVDIEGPLNARNYLCSLTYRESLPKSRVKMVKNRHTEILPLQRRDSDKEVDNLS